MAEGGMTCVKYVLFAFNFIFVLIGSLFIYGGVYIIQDQQAIQSVREIIDTPNTIAIASIVLGLLIFLIAFLGCCGALFESHCILMTFGFIVCVILALELTVAGLAFAFKSDLRNIASRELKIAVEHYNWTEPTAKYSVIVNHLQGSFKCCGFNSTQDWQQYNPNPSDRDVLPDSCCPRPHVNESTFTHNNLWTTNYGKDSGNCRNSNTNFYANPAAASGPFKTGCTDVLVDTLLVVVAPLGLSCLFIALFQLLGIIFAFSLARAAKRDYQVV